MAPRTPLGTDGAQIAAGATGRLAGMVFESTHVSTTIDRPADDVYAYVADPRHLSSWAAGLADRDVEHVGGEWVADSPMGRVVVAFAERNPYGIVDHDVTLPSGETVRNPMRVIAN